MKKCVLCSAELKLMNTPVFGAGKLIDDGEVCLHCFQKITKVNSGAAIKLKKMSLPDVQKLLPKTENENHLKEKLSEIKATIKGLNLNNVSAFLGKKEIDELPKILAENEKIDNIIQGVYSGGQGILVSTNRRLIFIDKGLIYGLKVEDFPLDKITSIQYETGLIFGKVKIHTSANISLIENVEKLSARQFAEFVRDKLSNHKDTKIQDVPQIDIISQLEKLGKLKDSGILSENEFNEQKKKLLERL